MNVKVGDGLTLLAVTTDGALNGEDVEIAGMTIPAGCSVFFGLGPANRDEERGRCHGPEASLISGVIYL